MSETTPTIIKTVDYEGPDRRKSRSIQQDMSNVISLAREIQKREGVTVPPDLILTREGEFINPARQEMGKLLKNPPKTELYPEARELFETIMRNTKQHPEIQINEAEFERFLANNPNVVNTANEYNNREGEPVAVNGDQVAAYIKSVGQLIDGYIYQVEHKIGDKVKGTSLVSLHDYLGHFWVAEASNDSPTGGEGNPNRNTVYDPEVAKWFKAKRPKEEFNGDAVTILGKIGSKLMPPVLFEYLRSVGFKLDEKTWSWLLTQGSDRDNTIYHEVGRALCGNSEGVSREFADHHFQDGGGRGALGGKKSYREAVSAVSTDLSPERQGILYAVKDNSAPYLERLGINWGEVEASLKKDPEKIDVLGRLISRGGKTAVLQDKAKSFLFGDASKESPIGNRNVVYDATAQKWLSDNYPEEKCDGNAVDIARSLGAKLMSRELHDHWVTLLEESPNQETWDYLDTDEKTREAGFALCCDRGRVGKDSASILSRDWGLRCALEVSKA